MPQNNWTTKQQIIDNINNRNAAYTYGPGSPDPTREDLNTIYGNAGNVLRTGDVALSPAQADLFTPQERALYHIADTAPGSHTGADIEMFYGNPGAPSGQDNSFLWLNQNSPSFWQGGDRAFEWDPKQGGILGKIGAHMPGASTYLMGQSIFDLIRGGLGKLFGGGGAGQQQQQDAGSGIPDNLQPTNPGYNYAPGFAPPGDPNAPKPFVPPPWLMPPTQEYGGQGFGSYAQAQNNFIPGLIDWNGPGQANPTGGEPGNPYTALLARFGLAGRGAGGKLPVSFQ